MFYEILKCDLKKASTKCTFTILKSRRSKMTASSRILIGNLQKFPSDLLQILTRSNLNFSFRRKHMYVNPSRISIGIWIAVEKAANFAFCFYEFMNIFLSILS